MLDELDDLQPGLLLFGGDVASGPLPVETIDRLRSLDSARFLMGNGDWGLLEEHRRPLSDWAGAQLDEEQRPFLLGFEPSVAVDDVLYCRSTPTSDEAFVTILTPDELAREIVGDVGHPMLVMGHTHSQFDRQVGDVRVVNAGSVGMPYEDRPGAYWLLVADGEPEHRRTEYDLEAAAGRVRAGGWPEADEWVAENLLAVPTAREAAAHFESRR